MPADKPPAIEGASAAGSGALRAPRLRSLHLANVKALAGAHTVPLAPLTLIYGPNAAGKSTIFRALSLLQDTLNRLNRAVFDEREWRDVIEELSRLVYLHDDTLTLSVGLDFTLGASSHELRRVALNINRTNRQNSGIHLTFFHGIGGEPSTNEVFESEAIQSDGEVHMHRLRMPDGPMDDAGLSDALRNTFMLGPHRGGPEDPYLYRQPTFMPWYLTDRDLGDDGLNDWLARLDVPYRVRRISIEERDPEQGEYLGSIDRTADWAGDAPSSADTIAWKLVDLRSGVEVNLDDVGYGVSQLLPIIDVCVRDSSQVICIEQPELHLHPRLQANLGDLFVDTVLRGNQILAETHSENILLRVRKLIRHGRIAPEQVAVLYVDNTPDEGATVRRLRLGGRGELLDPWPTGFFDDSLSDILGITG